MRARSKPEESAGVKKLKDDLYTKLPFSENRWMCLVQPASATRCLAPLARLEVTIVKARGLIPNEATGATKFIQPPQPFVRVYLDDTEVHESRRAKNSSRPVFNERCMVDVTAAKSMVRFHVYDKDIEDEGARDFMKMNGMNISVAADSSTNPLQHSLGFVEVCVADMPFDEEITGWLELRFPAHLQGTNKKRYKSHCKCREDVLHMELAKKFRADEGGRGATFMQLSKSVHQPTSAAHSGSLMSRIIGRVAKAATVEAADSEAVQFNAGELFVSMKLVRLTDDDYDVMYSYALDPPCLSYNPVVQESQLPEFDIQEVFDDAMDVKFAVVDDFFLCFASYVWYLISWQSRLISGLIVLSLMLCCWTYSLINAVVHGILAALLLMNRLEGQRLQMTTSGLNAPLTNQGFLTVARWNSILQMEAFLVRVMLHQACQVTSERDLHDFVATGFREILDPRSGFAEDDTSLTLADVVRVLKGMDWVVTKDVDDALIKQGTMVRIHERRRATVTKVLPPDSSTGNSRYVVHYDEINGDDDEDHEIVEDEEIHIRTLMPKIPKYMLGSKIKENVRKFAWQIDYGKKSAIIPALQQISDVLTWKKPLIAGLIFAVFVLRIIVNLIAFFYPEHSFSKIFARNLNHYIMVVILITSFVVFAQPLAWIRPMVIMRYEWATRKRVAPDMWPFFTSEDTDAMVLDVSSTEGSSPPKKAGDLSPKKNPRSLKFAKSPKEHVAPEAEDTAAPLLEPPKAGSKPCCVIC